MSSCWPTLKGVARNRCCVAQQSANSRVSSFFIGHLPTIPSFILDKYFKNSKVQIECEYWKDSMGDTPLNVDQHLLMCNLSCLVCFVVAIPIGKAE